MKIPQEEILQEGLFLDILGLCDGKNNISNITEKVGLTYKIVLARLQELESVGLIEMQKVENKKEGRIPTIKKEISSDKKFKSILEHYTTRKLQLQESIKNMENLEYIKKVLALAKSKRFISSVDTLKLISSPNQFINSFELNSLLTETKLLRERREITRAGAKFLREHDKK